MITGHASDTGACFERWPLLPYHRLGRSTLAVCAAGFGAYRARAPDHAAALRHALSLGVNLIDTSANDTDGASETLIGRVLADALADGDLRREHLVLVSKAGYIQAATWQRCAARAAAGQPFDEVSVLRPGLAHCIHPDFLTDQLDQTLSRLGCQTLDVLLLHNPEYFLIWCAQQGIDPDAARDELDRRLAVAFRHLEDERARGRIRAYGLSSNTLTAPPDHPHRLDLARVHAAAPPDHHLSVVQLPLNLLETGAVTSSHLPDAHSPLAFARAHDLGVLTSRTLNALLPDGQLVRLAEADALVPPDHPTTPPCAPRPPACAPSPPPPTATGEAPPP